MWSITYLAKQDCNSRGSLLIKDWPLQIHQTNKTFRLVKFDFLLVKLAKKKFDFYKGV